MSQSVCITQGHCLHPLALWPDSRLRGSGSALGAPMSTVPARPPFRPSSPPVSMARRIPGCPAVPEPTPVTHLLRLTEWGQSVVTGAQPASLALPSSSRSCRQDSPSPLAASSALLCLPQAGSRRVVRSKGDVKEGSFRQSSISFVKQRKRHTRIPQPLQIQQ